MHAATMCTRTAHWSSHRRPRLAVPRGGRPPVGRVATSPTLKARGEIASLMLAITDGHATAATGAFASSLDGGRCALCGTTFLLSMRDGVPFCQTCLNSAPEQNLADLPEPASTPRFTTVDGQGFWRGMQQQYLTKDLFKKAVADAARANGHKAVRQNHTRSNAIVVCMVCKDKTCPFTVKATSKEGLWQLAASKLQAWDHKDGCAGDARRWPSLQDLASDPKVQDIIRSTQTTAKFDQAMRNGNIVRSVQNLGYSF
eukprot:SAG25_NODE_1002_length_4348_cov_7.069663_1_plen_256_part_10